MTDTATIFDFDNTYAHELDDLVIAWQPDEVPAPSLVAVNQALAAELGIDVAALNSVIGTSVLAGDAVPIGAEPVAMVYAGHQFGGYSPRLGDGRAVLLGEVIDRSGQRRDIHLKGSGRTPLSRGGDGKAALGPMLREFLIAEAMHALGVPTTRALAVAVTGEKIVRDKGPVPGAVLTRVAASHLRVGTFEYSARAGNPDAFKKLADYSIARHYPEALDSDSPYLAFFEAVLDRQAALIAQWMLVGFIHGVMNTDNMTISGEGIDYGPCAFMDRYDPATVYSSIDHSGRYAFANQPSIATWNLTRLAETLVPLIGDDFDATAATLTEMLEGFHARFSEYWLPGFRAKLGFEHEVDDADLFSDLLQLMQAERLDYTKTFRQLAATLADADAPAVFDADNAAATDWMARWHGLLDNEGRDRADVAAAMDAINPIYIPRNHLVEEALAAATDGDLAPFEELLAVVTDPFTERDGVERFAEPAPTDFETGYQTFCGT